MDQWPFALAHHMGLLPLAWLVLLAVGGRPHRPGWWWMAGAFAVSWIADSLAHIVNPAIVSTVYPVLQVGVMAIPLLLSWVDVVLISAVLGMVMLQAMVWFGLEGPDVLLRTVAFGIIAALGWTRFRLPLLRFALLVGFGGGLIAWYGLRLAPSMSTWGLYQSTRLLSLCVFCVAASRYRFQPDAEPVAIAFPDTAFR